MPHPADFVDAHERHWGDANSLFDQGRWANADLLYDYSAECGLKAVMLSLGMRVDPQGSPVTTAHRNHVQFLWPEFKSFVAGQIGKGLLRRLPAGEPFADWSHHDRYAHHEHCDRAAADRHREATRGIRDIVQNSTVDQKT